MDPAHESPYYTGQRFTPVAAVLRATLDGHEFFFNPLEHNAETEHAGLASEFDLVTQPPGHAGAADGEGFVKVGVGVLKKKGQNYAFWSAYEVITPAKTSVEWGEDSATFKQTCEGAGGYAYELGAEVKVTADQVSVDWTLKNTGTKPLSTDNYVHNFFRFDDKPVGPDYVVSFPYDFEAEGLGEEQEQKGREVHFTKEIPKFINAKVPVPEGYDGENAFTVKHTKTGQSLAGLSSLPSKEVALHATKSNVCPEQFIHIEVAPGKEATWRRSYTFSVEK